MKEVTNPTEIEQIKQQLFDQRIYEQKNKKDYDYDENGDIERCSDCGSYINSHGHCPKCEY